MRQAASLGDRNSKLDLYYVDVDIMCVCVFITGEGESQKKGKQIWSYEERR